MHLAKEMVRRVLSDAKREQFVHDAQPPLYPRVPFKLTRSHGDYSLVELAIRLGLADGRPA